MDFYIDRTAKRGSEPRLIALDIKQGGIPLNSTVKGLLSDI